MIEIKTAILDAIGRTPLIKIGRVYAKLETVNPTGSVKDRMAAYLVRQAETRGELKPGQTIIECTSGNTGIALAMIAAIKGYKFIAVMPESMSVERRRMIQGFGGEVVLTPAKEDMIGAQKKYRELVKQYQNAWLPRQFENQGNIEAHRNQLGQEILEQMNGQIDVFCAGTGTGGTLIGVSQALKKANPKTHIVAIEPAESAVISGGKPGIHKIQGIGEGFVPPIVKNNMKWIDEVMTVASDEAIETSKKLMREYGLMVGISSGANFAAAERLAKKYERVATILPDRGERYLSENK